MSSELSEPLLQTTASTNSTRNEKHNTIIATKINNAINQIATTKITSSTTTEEESTQEKSGIIGASFNLANTIVGAGIVGLPYAFHQSGFLAGIILVILVGCLTAKSSNVLVQLSNFHPLLKQYSIQSFEELMYYPFGVLGRRFIMLNMFICAYGSMVAYLLIIKDTVSVLIGLQDGYEPECVLLVITFLVVLPICLQENIASLAFTSTLSMLCDIILIVLITVLAPISSTVQDYGGLDEVIRSNSIKPNVFIGLGVISTAMCCQQSLLLIFQSLRLNHIFNRWWWVTFLSIFFATMLGVIIGTVGYLGYMDDVEGNVLNNLSDNSTAANAARALLAVTMVFTYPMEFYVGRHILMSITTATNTTDDEGDNNTENQSPSNKCCPNQIQKITMVLIIITLVPALIFDDLGIVLSLTGATGASCLAYIGPGLVYIGIYGNEFLHWSYQLFGIGISYSNDHDDTNAVWNEYALLQQTQEEQGSNHQKVEQEENTTKPSYCKLFLYFILGFPIWNRTAFIGYQGMQTRVVTTTSPPSSSSEDVKKPTTMDFMIAIFFICFGVVAFVVGVFSDLYLIIHGE